MAERLEEAIAPGTAKERYSFDPLGPGSRLVGSGDLSAESVPFHLEQGPVVRDGLVASYARHWTKVQFRSPRRGDICLNLWT